MAKWRCVTAHYLNNPEGEWEHRETDRNTGKQARKTFVVPLYIDAETTVSNNKRECGGRDGIVYFAGDPTPDMEPLDDEAETISAGFASKWQHPIDSLPGNFSASLLSGLEQQLAEIVAKGAQAQAPAAIASAPGVSKSEFDALMAQVQSLAAVNADLMARLEAKPQVDDEEALPDDSTGTPPLPQPSAVSASRRA